MKIRTIRAKEDVSHLVNAVNRSAERALEQVAKNGAGAQGLQALWSMKFSPLGCDPLDADTPLNLIEQLNQTFTYLASAKAVELLFELHPELAPFTCQSWVRLQGLISNQVQAEAWLPKSLLR